MADDKTKTQQPTNPDAANKKNASGNVDSDEIRYFDTTIAKLVERENEETGEKEWVEVMSDNLYPGERLKREVDEERAKEKAEADAKAAERAKKDQK